MICLEESTATTAILSSWVERLGFVTERLGFVTKACRLDWSLRRFTSPTERVQLEDDPIILDYGKRRSSGYIRDLGDGATHELPSRGQRVGSA